MASLSTDDSKEMSLLLRGDSEVAAKSNSRSVINQVALRLHNFKDRAATMDITDLNLFAWCAFLKHLGKTIMLLVVSGIIGLAAYATFSSALLPGIEDTGNAGVKFGYILLSIIYLTTVSLFFEAIFSHNFLKNYFSHRRRLKNPLLIFFFFFFG